MQLSRLVRLAASSFSTSISCLMQPLLSLNRLMKHCIGKRDMELKIKTHLQDSCCFCCCWRELQKKWQSVRWRCSFCVLTFMTQHNVPPLNQKRSQILATCDIYHCISNQITIAGKFTKHFSHGGPCLRLSLSNFICIPGVAAKHIFVFQCVIANNSRNHH